LSVTDLSLSPSFHVLPYGGGAHIAIRKENAHAQKTKRDNEKINSNAENKVGWQKSSKKEAESRR
jgi:hypothetical protein